MGEEAEAGLEIGREKVGERSTGGGTEGETAEREGGEGHHHHSRSLVLHPNTRTLLPNPAT